MKERIPRKHKKLIKNLSKLSSQSVKLALDLLIKSRYDISTIPLIVNKEYIQYNKIKAEEWIKKEKELILNRLESIENHFLNDDDGQADDITNFLADLKAYLQYDEISFLKGNVEWIKPIK